MLPQKTLANSINIHLLSIFLLRFFHAVRRRFICLPPRTCPRYWLTVIDHHTKFGNRSVNCLKFQLKFLLYSHMRLSTSSSFFLVFISLQLISAILWLYTVQSGKYWMTHEVLSTEETLYRCITYAMDNFWAKNSSYCRKLAPGIGISTRHSTIIGAERVCIKAILSIELHPHIPKCREFTSIFYKKMSCPLEVYMYV